MCDIFCWQAVQFNGSGLLLFRLGLRDVSLFSGGRASNFFKQGSQKILTLPLNTNKKIVTLPQPLVKKIVTLPTSIQSYFLKHYWPLIDSCLTDAQSVTYFF